ncbi:response regulator [Bradyrhizobium sp.]|uniref:hybrid sensor histidine kinase/response regulator n=1 Tax=Bradyrhizobium sp. TaxID=376 RepID=UPI003C61B5C8
MMQDLTHRLLLVEDNPGDALLVSEALTEITNYRLSLEEVTSLKQASAALKSNGFDGIILDLTLPDSTGIETLSHVRAVSHGAPIIVLTGLDGGSGMREQAELLGAFEFVNKSELAQLLPRSVHWTLRHKRAEAQHRQFERLVGAIPDAVIVTDRAGVIRFVNDAAFELFGKRRDNFVGEMIGLALKEGEVSDIEIKRGKEKRSCEARVTGCEWNGVAAHLVLVRDMTEQKRLSEQLQHAQKMEAVGLMAGGVAHDFNNLLLVMLVYAEMLREECGTEDPRKTDITEIIHSIDRARALTGQLLAFSRKQPTLPSVIRLTDVVAGVHSMLRRTLPASIEIVTIAGDDLWPVLVDRGQIEQVLMNLAVNARDALHSGGRFAVEIENQRIERTDQGLAPGDYVAMRVGDNGTGIAPEHLDKIFDPFFTTKEHGRGTGLGLATCYGIVAQAGGRLAVESKLGVGTTFTILLPRTQQKAEQASDLVGEAEGPRGRETILIVEDDHAVMRATAATLKKAGYTILTAFNGDEASRLVQRQTDHIDLVLSDVVMPQLSGPEFAELLAVARPQVPVIFMTGYSDYPIVNDSGDNRIANRRAIMKPFRPNELLSTVREVLDGRPRESIARA